MDKRHCTINGIFTNCVGPYAFVNVIVMNECDVITRTVSVTYSQSFIVTDEGVQLDPRHT